MKKKNLYLVLLLSVIAVISACTPPVVKEKPKLPVEHETVIVEPVIKEVEPVVELPEQNVLILLSGKSKSYQAIANHVAIALGEHSSQVTLTGKLLKDKSIISDVKASASNQIVAIGLKAAKHLKGIKNKQVVFSLVVNHKDNKLVADNFKGVSALPSPEKLFKDWKALSPGLSKVAVVAGKNLDVYLARASRAAKKQGIQLSIEQVSTDKEFIYKSKHLKPGIEGQWILPDYRVLSGKALKEVMAYGSRRGKQIVVFSPKLLSFGGFFYVQPDEKEIADVILKRLSDSLGKPVIPGDSILPVMSHTMGINQNIARQFNLKIPKKYRKYIDGE